MNGNVDSLVSSMDKLSSESDSNAEIFSSKKWRENPSSNDVSVKTIIGNQEQMENRNDVSFHDVKEKVSNSNDLHQANHKSTVNNLSNHSTNVNNLNHHQPYYLNEKKFKSYKLISDPFLKKGAPRLYRYDGAVSSKETSLQPKDPRSHVPLLWNLREPIDLIVPRFKIDKNYVGIPPSIEVSITNLNDNINKSFLEDTLKKFDAIEEIEIFYHPTTKKHLGLAKVIFMTQSGAKACINKLNQTSLMGNIINVFFDAFAKKINQIYESIVNPPSSSNVTSDTFIDPNNMDKSSLSRMSKTSDYGSYDVSTEYCSNFSTPSAFENQSFYSSVNNQYDSSAQTWKSGNLGNLDYDKSPVRESLETRINNLLRQNRVGIVSQFLNDSSHQDSNLSSLSHILNNSNDHVFHRKNVQKKIDDSDAILGTPPSPFISASEYLKWHQITKEIDSGSNNDKTENDLEKFKEVDVKKNFRNDDDDDRMSLSSLSSGEKFEDNSVNTSNAALNFNTNDISSMIPGLANWNSTDGNPFANHDQINNSLYPQFMYHSFMQNNSQSFGYFAGFTVPPTLGSLLNDSSFNLNNIFKDKNRISKSDKDLLNELLVETAKASIKDLKEILRKDIYKKIVENFSFKMFDQWWEDSERKSKSTDLDNLDSATAERSPSSFKRTEIHIPFFNNPIFENSIQNRQNSLKSNFEYGVSRDLRAAMGKMPSFKRKIIKPKSPNRSIDDKLSDISDDEDYDNRKFVKQRQHRVPHYRRQRSISSESIPSRHRSVSSRSHSSSSSSSFSSSSSSSSSSLSSSSSSSGEDDSSSESSEDSESSDSDSDSSASSSSSTSSKQTSSSRSTKSSKSSARVLPTDSQKDLIEPIEDIKLNYDSDTSRTCSADETKEYEEELRLAESNMNGMHTNRNFISNSLNDIKKSKTREEFEASEALISLAASWFEQPTTNESIINESQDQIISKSNRPAISYPDPVFLDHNYCQLLADEELPQPMSSPMTNKDKSQRKTVETKRKRKKKENDLIVDENIIPSVLAVASEWRKAKRKAVSQPVNEFMENDNVLINEHETALIVEPPITFLPRDPNDENEIIYEFLRNGIDNEELGYLKRRYDQLLQEDNSNLPWLNDIHWVDHPPTNLQPPKKKRKSSDDPVARIHQTGCARSEGYYKLDRIEKMHHIANIPIASNDMEDGNTLRSKQIVTTQQLTREARNQRRLYNLVEQNSNYHTDLLKLNQLKFRKKQVKFARSKIHVWGLFALQPIPPDEMVIEYIGQRIRPMVAEIREKKYSNAGSSYLFKIDSDTIIDATHCGNVARFINHSCSPNCYAKVITVEGQKRIVIYSKQLIEVGQEITYDYKFPIEDDNKIPCLCRTSQCRGFLN